MTSTLVGNAAQSPAPSSIKGWRGPDGDHPRSRRERRSLRVQFARLRSIATAGTIDIDYDLKRTSVHWFGCDPVPSCRAYIRS
jgi:hypothetical protein